MKKWFNKDLFLCLVMFFILRVVLEIGAYHYNFTPRFFRWTEFILTCYFIFSIDSGVKKDSKKMLTYIFSCSALELLLSYPTYVIALTVFKSFGIDISLDNAVFHDIAVSLCLSFAYVIVRTIMYTRVRYWYVEES